VQKALDENRSVRVEHARLADMIQAARDAGNCQIMFGWHGFYSIAQPVAPAVIYALLAPV